MVQQERRSEDFDVRFFEEDNKDNFLPQHSRFIDEQEAILSSIQTTNP